MDGIGARRRIQRKVLDAEHAAVIAVRDDGVVGDDVMRRVQRDLELELARLEV